MDRLPQFTPNTLDEALILIERLREALARRDDFLALAAHELRNPLHSLSLQLASARRLSTMRATPEEIDERLSKAQDTLERYLHRTTVLLDITRLNANAYPLNVQTFDLVPLLSRLLDHLRGEAEFHGVVLTAELPKSCPMTSDPMAIEQVLHNLLINAFRHARATTVQLRINIVGDRTEISVVDDGIGVRPEQVARLFEKFTPRREGDAPGHGLGLWIIKLIADALGADIRLVPVAKGTQFEFVLPFTHGVDSGHE